MKLLVLAVLAVIGWKLLTGRWPWAPRGDALSGADRPGGEGGAARARAVLGLGVTVDRGTIIAAHRATIARVHPDRGGSSEAVHAADAARDLLLADVALREGVARPR